MKTLDFYLNSKKSSVLCKIHFTNLSPTIFASKPVRELPGLSIICLFLLLQQRATSRH